MDFDDYLLELASAAGDLRASSLARLSGLNTDLANSLAQVWPQIDTSRRRRIVDALIDLEEDNVEFNFDAVFTLGLSDEDSQVRLNCIRGLWEHDAPDLIAPLIALLEGDRDAAVRAEAAMAIGHYVTSFEEGRLRDRYFQKVEAALKGVLLNEGEVQEVRARALEAIGPHNGPWVRQAITRAYESDALQLKASAVHAMGRSCESRWLPLIFRELASEEPAVRYEAAVACGRAGDAETVPHLARVLTDPDEEVQQAAIGALGEIGGPGAREALTELADAAPAAVKEAALAALALIDFADDPLAFRHRI